MVASEISALGKGIWPRGSPGIPTWVRSPKPKARKACCSRSRPSFCADLGGADVGARRHHPGRRDPAEPLVVVDDVLAHGPAPVLAEDGVVGRDGPLVEGAGEDEGLDGRAGLEGVEDGAVAQVLLARGVGVEERRRGQRQDLAGGRVDGHRHPRGGPRLRTAWTSARSAAFCSPWSMVSSTRAPSSTRSGAGAGAEQVGPARVAQRGEPHALALQRLVPGLLDALEPLAVVADDAQELAGQLAPRVVAAGLLHEAHAGELQAADLLGLGRRDPPLHPGEAGALRDLLLERLGLELQRLGEPDEVAGPARRPGRRAGRRRSSRPRRCRPAPRRCGR